jgi:hypothetical protein
MIDFGAVAMNYIYELCVTETKRRKKYGDLAALLKFHADTYALSEWGFTMTHMLFHIETILRHDRMQIKPHHWALGLKSDSLGYVVNHAEEVNLKSFINIISDLPALLFETPEFYNDKDHSHTISNYADYLILGKSKVNARLKCKFETSCSESTFEKSAEWYNKYSALKSFGEGHSWLVYNDTESRTVSASVASLVAFDAEKREHIKNYIITF